MLTVVLPLLAKDRPGPAGRGAITPDAFPAGEIVPETVRRATVPLLPSFVLSSRRTAERIGRIARILALVRSR
jgi:hypothetical protein